MSTSHLKPLLEYIENVFPESFAEIKKRDLINKNLFSPFSLELPIQIFEQVQSFVSIIYQIKDSPPYQSELPANENFSNWPITPSLLTCFDFHYSKEMGLKLIEINTNASLYLPAILQSCAHLQECMDSDFGNLLSSFQQSFDLKHGDSISVFDENPENEGLYFEFLLFKEWLTRKGYPTNIVSLENYSTEAKENIYNRYTDFYLRKDKSKTPFSDYTQKRRKFSPNPREYFLLADKRRLQLLKKHLHKYSPELSQIIPESKLFSDFSSPEELWAERKKYFFKPSSSFGSKGVYKGKGISRKAFDAIYLSDFMAQELCPPGKQTFEYEKENVEMKYDLRFFTFNGKVHNRTARLYQGQVTNMRTPLGGIAPIYFTS